jgi:hypothetical protein
MHKLDVESTTFLDRLTAVNYWHKTGVLSFMDLGSMNFKISRLPTSAKYTFEVIHCKWHRRAECGIDYGIYILTVCFRWLILNLHIMYHMRIMIKFQQIKYGTTEAAKRVLLYFSSQLQILACIVLMHITWIIWLLRLMLTYYTLVYENGIWTISIFALWLGLSVFKNLNRSLSIRFICLSFK